MSIRNVSPKNALGANSANRTRIWIDMTGLSMKDFYEKYQNGQPAERLVAELIHQFDGRRYRRLLLTLRPQKEKLNRPLDILDLGCGLMGSALGAANSFMEKVHSLMFTPEAYDEKYHTIRTWLGIDAPKLLINQRVRSANISDTAEPSASRDVIILNRIITSRMVVKKSNAAVALFCEAKRILRPAGIVVGTMPRKSMGRHDTKNRQMISDEEAMQHLRQALKAAGFRCAFRHIWDKHDDIYFLATKI